MTEQSPPESRNADKPAGGIGHFVAELRQRSVFKVAAAYGVTGWLLIEITTNVFPVFNFPQWTMQFVVVPVLLGFPIALVLSWIYEATPQGIKRTVANEAGDSVAPVSTGKLNGYIIVALSVLVVFLLVERVYFADTGSEPATAEVIAAGAPSEAAVVAAAPAQTITDKSIAVLPLDDFAAGGEEEYFADGLTEEILTALSRTPDLLVAARTSSFQYKDQAVDVQDIAQALGVAHILEGSVRRSADRLRVTVQLIRASDGFHLWSENYDRTPDDIIAVQEDIAFQIAVALQTAMDPVALRQMVQAGTQSVEAYNAYLKGLANQEAFTAEGQQVSYESFEQARAIDPLFAAAHFGAAMHWRSVLSPNLIINTTDGLSAIDATTVPNFLERIGLAIANAKLPERYYYQALEASVKLQYSQVRQLLRLYVEAAPADLGTTTALRESSTLRLAAWAEDRELVVQLMKQFRELPTLSASMMGDVVFHSWAFGEIESGREFARQAIARYPEDEFIRYQAHRLLLGGGYLDEAREIAATITGIQVPAANVAMVKLRQACADGNDAEALRIFESMPKTDSSYWNVLFHLGRIEEATDYLKPYDREPYLFSLSTFVGYPYFDITQYPNLQAVLQREGVTVHPFQPFPYTCTTTAQ